MRFDSQNLPPGGDAMKRWALPRGGPDNGLAKDRERVNRALAEANDRASPERTMNANV